MPQRSRARFVPTPIVPPKTLLGPPSDADRHPVPQRWTDTKEVFLMLNARDIDDDALGAPGHSLYAHGGDLQYVGPLPTPSAIPPLLLHQPGWLGIPVPVMLTRPHGTVAPIRLQNVHPSSPQSFHPSEYAPDFAHSRRPALPLLLDRVCAFPDGVYNRAASSQVPYAATQGCPTHAGRPATSSSDLQPAALSAARVRARSTASRWRHTRLFTPRSLCTEYSGCDMSRVLRRLAM
ncbi:hypothetical protein C8Q77DRAFT_678168 [Trametes polyzona]|nr:hypothetical protein C8Q77DRAFT_678168 [Trametes polyzona]